MQICAQQDRGDGREYLEARVGFEPTNGGFADLSLGPLGYRAKRFSIAKLSAAPGDGALDSLGVATIFLWFQAAKRF